MEYRVVKKDSPISFLQQRLNYTDQHPEQTFTWLLENVPKWPKGALLAPSISAQAVSSYDNCQGNIALRAAICQREARHYQLHVTPEQVLISNGAFHGIAMITRHLHHQGKVALCQTPILDSVYKLLEIAGYRIQTLPIHNGQVDTQHLTQLCATEDVGLIYLNLPHNPTGDILVEDELDALMNIAQQYNSVVLADLVYDAFLFDDHQAVNPLLHRKQWDNLFIVNSMSKGYGVPGIRVGWIISSAHRINMLSSYLEAECISVCTASQHYATQLLQAGNALLVNYVQRKWLEAGELLKRIPAIRWTAPAGGTQYFIELPVDDIEAFADFMLLEYGLVLVTSGNYVDEPRPCLRFPIALDHRTLKKGITYLQYGLDNWNNRSTSHSQKRIAAHG